MRVAIIGGGIIGCTAALALADRGADVTLIERATLGAEASSAAAGILGAQVEARAHPSRLPRFLEARASFAPWAELLRARTGLDVGYRVTGALRVARDGREAEEIARDVDSQRRLGLRAELVDSGRARQIEPSLSPAIEAAAHFPDESQVDPPALLRALVAAMPGAGRSIALWTHTTVASLLIENDRCGGVVLEGGDAVRADATLLAAGSWSSLVVGVPAIPRVRPARGQIVLLDERPPLLRSMIFGACGYAVPRGDGRVLCGSTFDLVGYRREVEAAGVAAILANALALDPSLAASSFAGSWASFRPYIDDDAEPLVGAAPLPGLFLATGHHRNGILLAKVTADAVADAILGEP